MKINMKQSINPIRAVNIISNDIDLVNSSIHSLNSRLQLNEYQTIPKNTNYCKCYYNGESDDTWKYYLREIVNPDQAISKFFTAIRNEPFFVSTKVDNDICKKDLIIRTYDGDHVSIKVKGKTLYDGHISNIPNDIRDSVINYLEMNQFDTNILFF